MPEATGHKYRSEQWEPKLKKREMRGRKSLLPRLCNLLLLLQSIDTTKYLPPLNGSNVCNAIQQKALCVCVLVGQTEDEDEDKRVFCKN